MKRPTIQMFDDLDYHESEQLTEATNTCTLGWQGRWVELDLTDPHLAELAGFVARYMDAGVKPARQPTVRRQVAQEREQAHKSGSGYSTGAMQRNMVKAAWAERAGFKVTKRRAGGWYFPVKTERAWLALPAAERASLLAAAGADPAEMAMANGAAS